MPNRPEASGGEYADRPAAPYIVHWSNGSAWWGRAASEQVLIAPFIRVGRDRAGVVIGGLQIARRCQALLRRADLLGRYGGDEFVLCLPATDEEGAHELVAGLEDTHPSSWTVGLTTAQPGDTLADILARADANLYARKRAGRRA